MAFDKNGLLSFGSGGSLNSTTRRSKIWHYISADAATAIDDSGYFDAAATLLQKGDVIFVTGSATGTATLTSYVVQSITAGVVVITPHVDAV